jgi:predicted transcriptional regulator of viral defense system
LKKTLSDAILEQLAEEQRRVMSGWRALVLLRRATFSTPQTERRWTHLPQTAAELYPLFRQMRLRGELSPITGLHQVYEVTVPFARQGFLDEREVLLEVHPYAVISHFSALVFHGLTDEQPKGLTVTISADMTGGLLPIGTAPRDWEGVVRPAAIRARVILGRPIEWLKVKPERFFGFEEYEPVGLRMRYTTPERTLIDALQSPELCGGIRNVLEAWVNARNTLHVDDLVYQVERYGLAILRQRVGYILEQIGLSHPRLDHWSSTSHRGSSSRLVGSEPFASIFDARWNLSLNGPVETLHEHAA